MHTWSPNFAINNQGHLTICKVFRIYSLKIIILGNFLKFFKWNLLPETDVTRKNNCIFWYCSCPLNLKNRIVFCVAAPELLKKKLYLGYQKVKIICSFQVFPPLPQPGQDEEKNSKNMTDIITRTLYVFNQLNIYIWAP